jgi:proton-dependent oligopeptide transporter, POT family
MSVAAAAPVPGTRSAQRTFLGHPIGLYFLFFTEMWERFSYYGMRGLLMVYMLNYFKWIQKDASTVYKIYTTLVYVTPILGGYLADRFLGNKRAVVIGAVLMAIGHFLMAFEDKSIFVAALIFLILGNGFFKPNMSTQVGRLYPANDGRLDGAYTIFYMGINIGAFLSPLVCGWLADNTMGGYHTGFTMAGIGMVIGLVTYLVGQPFIREIAGNAGNGKEDTGWDQNGGSVKSAPVEPMTADQGRPQNAPLPGAGPHVRALSEEEVARQPSVLGSFSDLIPWILLVMGAACVLASPALIYLKILTLFDGIMLGVLGVSFALMAYVAWSVANGLRDRIVAILILGIFVVFFWAAGEQAGNVLTVWADKNTDRYVTQTAPAVDPIPQAEIEEAKKVTGEEKPANPGVWHRFLTMFQLKPRPASAGTGFFKSLNPVPTAWFQAINPLAIVVLAPFFAWGWVLLDRKGLQPSIPLKMAIGLALVTFSVAIMIWAAKEENQVSTAPYEGELPSAFVLIEGNKVAIKNEKTGVAEQVQAGRLTFDSAAHTFTVHGVLSDNDRDHLVAETAPEDFKKKVKELVEASQKINGDSVKEVSVTLDVLPPGFDTRYAGLKKGVLTYQEKDHTLTAHKDLADKEKLALEVAAGNPGFRNALNSLLVDSNHFTVSWWWVFWSYIATTMGELCLSPVGLSMVSKLAPARSATMLMGLWMLTSAFGNFAAGLAGEYWGIIAPIPFFVILTAVVGASSVVLFLLCRLVVATMHGVK